MQAFIKIRPDPAPSPRIEPEKGIPPITTFMTIAVPVLVAAIGVVPNVIESITSHVGQVIDEALREIGRGR